MVGECLAGADWATVLNVRQACQRTLFTRPRRVGEFLHAIASPATKPKKQVRGSIKNWRYAPTKGNNAVWDRCCSVSYMWDGLDGMVSGWGEVSLKHLTLLKKRTCFLDKRSWVATKFLSLRTPPATRKVYWGQNSPSLEYFLLLKTWGALAFSPN